MSQKRQSTTNNDTDGESRKKVCLLSRCISSDATNDSACFECTDAASSSNADDSTESKNTIENGDSHLEDSNDTRTALIYLRQLFPSDKFQGLLAPIIIKHLLYCFVCDRDLVDQQLSQLEESGEIVLINSALVNSSLNSTLIVHTDDYRSHVICHSAELIKEKLMKDFLLVMLTCREGKTSRQKLLKDFKLRDEEIALLVRANLLNMDENGLFCLALPRVSQFWKCFNFGRKAILTVVAKSKNREILQEKLESCKLPRVARLGILYHVYDIVGAGLVERSTTAAGQLLRLPSSVEQT